MELFGDGRDRCIQLPRKPRTDDEILLAVQPSHPEQRGHDLSVKPAMLPREVDERVREKLDTNDESIPLYRYKIHSLDNGYAHGPWSKTTNRSLVSRCTRSRAILWIPNEDARTVDQDKAKKEPCSEERIVYMKDTWRFLSTLPDVEVLREGQIYQILYEYNTPNIPQDVVGGNIERGRTGNYDLLSDETTMEWLCLQPWISVYQHYQVVLWVVGQALFSFTCTKDLALTVLHALQGELTPSSRQTTD